MERNRTIDLDGRRDVQNNILQVVLESSLDLKESSEE